MVSQIEAPSSAPAPVADRPLACRVEGLVQVFTCGPRSFLTDVMAQAMRVAGQGTPVLVVQFLKGGIGQGSDRPMRLVQNLDWLRCNLTRKVSPAGLAVDGTAPNRAPANGDGSAPAESEAARDREGAPQGNRDASPPENRLSDGETAAVRALWDWAKAAVMAGDYDLVVFDELSLAIALGVLSEEEVLEFLAARPERVDAILTGPQMPEALLDAADQVTQIRRSRRP